MIHMGDQRADVESALAGTEVAAIDVAAVGLARLYADLIDNAAPAAKYTKALAELRTALDEHSQPKEVLDAWKTVTDALAQHSVASDLGPKLLAALTALGMTPAGRGEKGKAKNDRGGTKLDELRARRADRQRGAANLHATTP